MTRRRAAPRNAFLSHSSRDRRFADRLAAALRDHNVPVWYSRTHVVGAQQWHDEIGAALRQCDFFLLVLSPDSVKSRWVKHELLYALQERRFEGRIAPLICRPCDPSRLSWTLSGFQAINFAHDFNKGIGALLRVWGISSRPHGGKPARRRKPKGP